MNAVLLHDGKMDRIARRQLLPGEHDRLGAFHRAPVNRQNVVDDAEERIKGRLNGVTPAKCHVPMQNLLPDLGVCNEARHVGHVAVGNTAKPVGRRV